MPPGTGRHYASLATHEYDLLLFGLFAIFVAAKFIGEIFERAQPRRCWEKSWREC